MDKESFKQGFWYGIMAAIVAETESVIKDESQIRETFDLFVNEAYEAAIINTKLELMQKHKLEHPQ